MTLVQVQVNKVCETLYEVETKAKIEAPVKSQAKVENKTLRKRTTEVKAKATLADMLVAVEVLSTLSQTFHGKDLKRWWTHLLTG